MTSIPIRVNELIKNGFDFETKTKTEVRRKGWEAFMKMREKAIANGAADMTLDEINEEISAVRNHE